MTEYKEKGVETCPKYGNDTITWRRTSKMNVLGFMICASCSTKWI
jgi:hypothetical protein